MLTTRSSNPSCGRLLQTATLAVACAAVASPDLAHAAARNAFDGNWSVVINTQSGACDPSFRYGVQISNGQVLNNGGSAANVQGRVSPSGIVHVNVQAGGQWASGSGRLDLARGGGRWQGQGSAGACSGTWVAQRATGAGVASEGPGPMGVPPGGPVAQAPGGPTYDYAPGGPIAQAPGGPTYDYAPGGPVAQAFGGPTYNYAPGYYVPGGVTYLYAPGGPIAEAPVGLPYGYAPGGPVAEAPGGPVYNFAPDQIAQAPEAPAQDMTAYCAARFRTYDPASGTYMGYDGMRHPCP